MPLPKSSRQIVFALSLAFTLTSSGRALGEEPGKLDEKALQRAVVGVLTMGPGAEPAWTTGFFIDKSGLICASRRVIQSDSNPDTVILVAVGKDDSLDKFDYYRAQVVVLPKPGDGDHAIILKIADQGKREFSFLTTNEAMVENGASFTLAGCEPGPDSKPKRYFASHTIKAVPTPNPKRTQPAYYRTDGLKTLALAGSPWFNDKGEVFAVTQHNGGVAMVISDFKSVLDAGRLKGAAVKPSPGPIEPSEVRLPSPLPLTADYWEVTKGKAKFEPEMIRLENDAESFWITSNNNLPEDFQLVIRAKTERFLKRPISGRPDMATLGSFIVRYACHDPKLDIMESGGQRVHSAAAHGVIYKNDDAHAKYDQRGSTGAFTMIVRKQGPLFTVTVGGESKVRLMDEKPLSGGKLSIGGFQSKLEIQAVSLTPLGRESSEKTADFVKVGKDTVLNIPKPIPVGGLAPATMPAFEDIPLIDKSATVKLVGPVNQTVVGGNGRFLIFRLEGKRKLAVVDVVKREQVLEIPTVEDRSSFAAGLNHLFILSPSQKKIIRWNLRTLEREDPLPWPAGLAADDLKFACMGSASAGPLFVHQGGKWETAMVNLESGKITPIPWVNWPAGRQGPAPSGLTTTPDGTVLIGWGNRMEVFAVGGKDSIKQTVAKENMPSAFDGKRPLLSTADGRLFFTQKEIVDRKLQTFKLDPRFDKNIQFPAMEPGFLVSLMPPKLKENDFSYKPTFSSVEILQEDRAKVTKLVAVFELKDEEFLPWNQRIFFYPYADMLATLNWNHSEVHFQKCGFRRGIEVDSDDYLTVVSRPPSSKRGAKLEHQLEILSKGGAPKVKLISGPKGLTITPEGKLVWNVPAAGEIPSSEVTIEISDRSGRECNYTFLVGLRN